MGFLERLRRNVAGRGLAGTLRHVVRRLFPRAIPVHPFDVEHGVETSGLLYAERLTTGHAHDRHSTAYWGTAPSLLYGAVAEWQRTLPATGCSLGEYTFVDVGSGKGRVVMLASTYAFRAVVGVELNPGLTLVAERNLSHWLQRPRACEAVSVVTGDVLEVPLPQTPLLLYLFNPFHAPVLRLLLRRLRELPRTCEAPVDVIYTRPDHAVLFEEVPGMTLLWKGEIEFTAEERRADAFGTTRQTAHVYRLLPSGGARA